MEPYALTHMSSDEAKDIEGDVNLIAAYQDVVDFGGYEDWRHV